VQHWEERRSSWDYGLLEVFFND